MGQQGFFEGWYFKQQCGGRTIALIPAHHCTEDGVHSASLQVITEETMQFFPIPMEQWKVVRWPFSVQAGACHFSLKGCHIDCLMDAGRLKGDLKYRNPVPPRYDMMGPFRFVSGMECRHSVRSLHHRVDGVLHWGTDLLDFNDGTGYIEGDRGVSFPKRYCWTQCGWEGNCVMLSVADIPFCGGQFVGCIGSILLHGQEKRIATYTGARVLRVGPTGVVVRQGEWELRVTLEQARAQRLQAPCAGAMARTIHESASCRVRYQLLRGTAVVLDFTGDMASFEAEWPEK